MLVGGWDLTHEVKTCALIYSKMIQEMLDGLEHPAVYVCPPFLLKVGADSCRSGLSDLQHMDCVWPQEYCSIPQDVFTLFFLNGGKQFLQKVLAKCSV